MDSRIKKKVVKGGVVVVSATIFLFVVKNIELDIFIASFKSIRWPYVFGSFFFYIITNSIRSIRFKVLLSDKISNFKLFFVVAKQNFWNTLIPFRLGEFSYIALIKNEGVVPIGESAVSLLSARLFDIFALSTIFLYSILFGNQKLPGSELLATIALILFFGSLGAVFLGIFMSGELLVNNFIVSSLPIKFRPRYIKIINDASNGFAVLRKKKKLFFVAFLSFATWVTVFVSGFLLFRSLSLPISFTGTLFAYTLPIFAYLTPFFAPAGIGSYEASLATGLVLIGIPFKDAAPMVVIFHIFELLFTISLAMFAFMAPSIFRATKASFQR